MVMDMWRMKSTKVTLWAREKRLGKVSPRAATESELQILYRVG